MTEKTIKNISVEEMEKVGEADLVAGENLKRPKNVEKPAVTTKYLCKMKEMGDSFFEPLPELFLLPTRNKIYNGEGITKDGSIYIRRFTTNEENMIQGMLVRDRNKDELTINGFLHIMNDAIDACIKSDVSIYDLAIIDKIPLLVKLISMAYGKKLEVIIPCEKCEKEHTISINLDKDFVVNYIDDKFIVPKTIELKKFPFPVEIDLTIPTIEFEDAFGGETIDLIEQFKAMIVDARGTKPDGTPITAADIPMIVQAIHKDDKELIKKYIDSYTHIGTDLQIKPIVLCDNTGTAKEKYKDACEYAGKEVQPTIPLRFLLNALIS